MVIQNGDKLFNDCSSLLFERNYPCLKVVIVKGFLSLCERDFIVSIILTKNDFFSDGSFRRIMQINYVRMYWTLPVADFAVNAGYAHIVIIT